MSKVDLIRAWKDEEYRLSLTEAPESPVGSLELTDAELEQVAGGGDVICFITVFIYCGLTLWCGQTIVIVD